MYKDALTHDGSWQELYERVHTFHLRLKRFYDEFQHFVEKGSTDQEVLNIKIMRKLVVTQLRILMKTAAQSKIPEEKLLIESLVAESLEVFALYIRLDNIRISVENKHGAARPRPLPPLRLVQTITQTEIRSD
jgi:hypothetical protein